MKRNRKEIAEEAQLLIDKYNTFLTYDLPIVEFKNPFDETQATRFRRSAIKLSIEVARDLATYDIDSQDMWKDVVKYLEYLLEQN